MRTDDRRIALLAVGGVLLIVLLAVMVVPRLDGRQTTILVVGDSLSVIYPQDLEVELGSRYLVTNIAEAGNTTTQALAYLPSEVGSYDKVIMMIGTNDIGADLSGIELNYQLLVDILCSSGAEIYLLTIMPFGQEGQNETDRLAMNEFIDSLASEQVHVIDIASHMADPDNPNSLPVKWQRDGDVVHPNYYGAQEMADFIAPYVR